MSIHAEDAEAYALTMHTDMRALIDAVERVANLLALSLDGERPFTVRQSGVTITREDRE